MFYGGFIFRVVALFAFTGIVETSAGAARALFSVFLLSLAGAVILGYGNIGRASAIFTSSTYGKWKEVKPWKRTSTTSARKSRRFATI